MKKILLSAILALGVGFANIPTALAAIVASLDSDNVTKLLDGKPVTANLFDLRGTTLTDWGTSTTFSSMAYKYQGAFYFTNTTGLQKQVVGSVTATTLRAGPKLQVMGMAGTSLVVRNTKSGTGSGTGSFIYNLSTKKSMKFTPTVKEIAEASLYANGASVGMIAKNSAGKQHLFFSRDSVAKLQESPLPKYATSCSTIAVSPAKNLTIVGCTYNVPGKPKGQEGYTLVSLSKGVVGTQVRTITTKSLNRAEWLSSSKLITIETDTSQATTITEHVVSGGKIVNSKRIGADVALTYGDRPVLASPIQILKNSSGSFLYSFLFLSTDAVEPQIIATYIGSYDTVSSTDTVLVHDGTFKFLAER